jgi:hypothetical protein
MRNMSDELVLSDPKLAAAASVLGGRLRRVSQDPSGRVVFAFEGLPDDFLASTFNGDVTINLRDYISALEQVQGVIAQYRTRRAR